MLGVSYLSYCRNAVYLIIERGFRDIVHLYSLLARQIFGHTNSFNSKDDSLFLGIESGLGRTGLDRSRKA